jgi:2-amino-4-hydroxy-6-hydroxymethyldihydropteridine diphosphokinase
MRAYLGVGTNLGDRWKYLALAARELRGTPGVAVVRASHVYENDAQGGPPGQPRFLNAVLEIQTSQPPERLLATAQAVERAALRRRETRWGPRTLDIDLLLYGDVHVETPRLTLPHPRLAMRRFVLLPLSELCPDREIPGTGAAVAELLRAAPPHPMRRAGLFPR